MARKKKNPIVIPYLKLFQDSMDVLCDLTDPGIGRVMRATFAYMKTGEKPVCRVADRLALNVLIGSVNRCNEAYVKKCEVNRESGRKGGLAAQKKRREALIAQGLDDPDLISDDAVMSL